jgi:hypothetical protein
MKLSEFVSCKAGKFRVITPAGQLQPDADMLQERIPSHRQVFLMVTYIVLTPVKQGIKLKIILGNEGSPNPARTGATHFVRIPDF